MTVVGSGTLPAMKPMHTRPITLKCKVATVVIAVPGPPRMRIGPLVWNCPRCEFRRDLCIDVYGGARLEEESRGVRELGAERTVIQDTVRATSYAWRSATAGEKNKGVVERSQPKQETFKPAQKS